MKQNIGIRRIWSGKFSKLILILGALILLNDNYRCQAQTVQPDVEDLPVGSTCTEDTMCASFCCNNDNDLTTSECVEIDDNSRCRKRETTDKIVLVLLIIVLIMSIGICGIIKHMQNKKQEQRLLQLKIDQHLEKGQHHLRSSIAAEREANSQLSRDKQNLKEYNINKSDLTANEKLLGGTYKIQENDASIVSTNERETMKITEQEV